MGLEIRREVHQGELSEWRRAALPVAAAIGGMLVPAALYLALALAGAPATKSGWGVPMATDILVGFLVGKPLGVIVAGWLTLRLGIGTLPAGMNLKHLVVFGVVAGVGLTMALFIAQLAFADAAMLAAAKLAVLAASTIAAALALGLGRVLLVAPGGAVAASSTGRGAAHH